MLRLIVVFGLLLTATNTASATIVKWGGTGTGYEIVDNTIKITAAGEYKFYSETGGQPDIIEWIRVQDAGVTDTVKVHVVHEYGGDGASDVKEIDLSGATPGELGELKISEDLGEIGGVTVDYITGTVEVDGGLYSTLQATSVTGPLSIGRVVGAIDVGSLGILDVGGGGATTGTITVGGNYGSAMKITAWLYGTVTIEGNMTGTIQTSVLKADGEVNVTGSVIGTIELGSFVVGTVDIDGDLTGHLILNKLDDNATIDIAGDVTTATPMDEPAILIEHSLADVGLGGAVGADSPPVMHIAYGMDKTLDGVIGINRSLEDVENMAVEIATGPLGTRGAIVVDYTYWLEDQVWEVGAKVEVDGVEYTGNTPADRVYEITGCRGDMDNDGELTSSDATAFDYTETEFVTAYPGLKESRVGHGDVDGLYPAFSPADEAWLDLFIARDVCCATTTAKAAELRCDFDDDNDVDLSDLAALLALYTMECGDAEYDDLYDINADCEISLSDLSSVLSVYGAEDICGTSSGLTMSTANPLPIDVTAVPIDTSGYTGNGFVGEVDHFVFDIKVQIEDTVNDDWTSSGVDVDAKNSATFRLSQSASWADQYATFVGSPWTTLPTGSAGTTVGRYDPTGDAAVFGTGEINVAWIDTATSLTGPATVMRLVIDVSNVTNADVSGGFGSVYFAQVPAGNFDIQVAEISSGHGNKEDGGTLVPFSGKFYVTGQ